MFKKLFKIKTSKEIREENRKIISEFKSEENIRINKRVEKLNRVFPELNITKELPVGTAIDILLDRIFELEERIKKLEE